MDGVLGTVKCRDLTAAERVEEAAEVLLTLVHPNIRFAGVAVPPVALENRVRGHCLRGRGFFEGDFGFHDPAVGFPGHVCGESARRVELAQAGVAVDPRGGRLRLEGKCRWKVFGEVVLKWCQSMMLNGLLDSLTSTADVPVPFSTDPLPSPS